MDATLADLEPGSESLGELLSRLGCISPDRVRMKPAPGTATVKDVARLLNLHKRKFELIEGTLVEKIMGYRESLVAAEVSGLLRDWNRGAGKPGFVGGSDGPFHLMETLVRVPDVSFTRRDRFEGGEAPDQAVPDLAPDLAVEVLSEGNTREEMERKLKEYFLSEVQLVWYIDPRTRTVRVFTSPDDVTELSETDTLDGGDVLPGFAVEVSRLFDQLAPAPKPEKPPKANGGKKPKKRK